MDCLEVLEDKDGMRNAKMMQNERSAREDVQLQITNNFTILPKFGKSSGQHFLVWKCRTGLQATMKNSEENHA